MGPNATPVQGAYASASRRWPDLALALEAFRRQVDRLALAEAIVEARAEDLFLVAAVLDDVPGAVAHFDDLLRDAVGIASRVDSAVAFIEDLKQELHIRLLTGDAPKLLTYSGTGALADWLRVVALRTALNLKRSDHLHPTAELPEAVLGGQESAQLKRWYLEDFHAALETGFRRLTARERTLLKLHFIDHLNIERMAPIYGVNRATIARWLVAVRQRLFEEVKSELGAKHGLDTADVKSLYRLMQRDVHVTVSRILQE